LVSTAVSLSGNFDPDEALSVSEDAIQTLFGRNRAALLRMSGLPMQKDSEKE
jgi:hypothetical protein